MFYLVNIYMPFESPDNYDQYLEHLGVLQSFIEDCESSYICICGDFNADPRRRFYEELYSFCCETGLLIVDCNILPENSYTYYSHMSHTTSWLDHIVCSASMATVVTNVIIQYGRTVEDHIPINFEINMEVLSSQFTEITERGHDHMPLNWDKAESTHLNAYLLRTHDSLNATNKYSVALQCTNVRYRCEHHIRQLDDLYNAVVSSLDAAAAGQFRSKIITIEISEAYQAGTITLKTSTNMLSYGCFFGDNREVLGMVRCLKNIRGLD